MKALETLKVSFPATATTTGSSTSFRSSSHLWHQARRKKPSATATTASTSSNSNSNGNGRGQQSGSSIFSFVSLSACLPCLTTKLNPTKTTTTTTSTANPSPSPTEQEQQSLSFPNRIVEYPSSRRSSGGTIRKPELAKAAPRPPPSPTSTTKQLELDDDSRPVTTTTSLPPLSPPAPQPTPDPITMADRTLQQILSQLRSNPGLAYAEANSLLSRAKIALLQLRAATPGAAGVSPAHLALARDVYEQGALFSIRARNPDAFTRYVSQLQPFYELPATGGGAEGERNKVTGLYLLLLLTQGRYSEFHSELETLSTRAKEGGGAGEIENDRFLGYPIKLERWLMEGSYDRVWKSMKSREVPSEEYGVFSEILTSQIRSEIASSSERAYPSLPLSSTKSLLFLDSEGAVVDFARHRGWLVRDGHIYFPASASSAESGEGLVLPDDNDAAGDEKEFSRMVIENALGYARELETIV
ncbi:SAC3/GANP/Nin1/mts3/eIF-3 p25 family-domain-containing protein [Jackrogersella minutella]|nr:SAC3/GANP/Nin1/mts3/eIF-3 p25 family-domain-containing protein [Jackrogersella minutella]